MNQRRADPTTRGRPLKVFQPSGGGCLLGFLLVLIGFGLGATGLASLIEEAPLDLDELGVYGGMLLAGVIVLAIGAGLSWKAARTKLLIFENGFVRRDWRGRETFVPWERLEVIEVRTSFFSGMSLLMRYGYVVAVVRKADGSREEILLKREGTGLMASNEPSEEIREMTSRAGLQREGGGCLSMTEETWRRPHESDDDA